MWLHCSLPSARWRVTLALIVASLLWGSLYPAAKPALAVTGPMQVTFCRVALAFVSLALLTSLVSGPGLPISQLRDHWRAVLVLGLFNFAVSQVLAMSAQSLLTALTLANGGFAPILNASAEVQLLLLYLGIGCTAVNFALWYYGLKHTSAAAASAYQYMIPPTSVALAAVFLHEPITPALIFGTLCILLGLLGTQRASIARASA